MGSLLCAKAGLRSGLMGLVDWEGDGDLDFPPPRHAWSSAPNPNQTAVAVGITTRSLSLCPSTTSTDLAIRDLPSMRAPRTPGHGAAGGRRGVCPVIPMPKRQSHLTARTAAGRQPFIAVHCSEENPHSDSSITKAKYAWSTVTSPAQAFRVSDQTTISRASVKLCTVCTSFRPRTDRANSMTATGLHPQA